jgi:hypothetical protein
LFTWSPYGDFSALGSLGRGPVVNQALITGNGKERLITWLYLATYFCLRQEKYWCRIKPHIRGILSAKNDREAKMYVAGEVALKIERDILACLDALKKEKGLTDEAWGKAAFEDEPINYRRKIQNLKKPQANGQPQRLNVGDFVRLCAPLGKDPGRLLIEILGQNNL